MTTSLPASMAATRRNITRRKTPTPMRALRPRNAPMTAQRVQAEARPRNRRAPSASVRARPRVSRTSRSRRSPSRWPGSEAAGPARCAEGGVREGRRHHAEGLSDRTAEHADRPAGRDALACGCDAQGSRSRASRADQFYQSLSDEQRERFIAIDQGEQAAKPQRGANLNISARAIWARRAACRLQGSNARCTSIPISRPG